MSKASILEQTKDIVRCVEGYGRQQELRLRDSIKAKIDV